MLDSPSIEQIKEIFDFKDWINIKKEKHNLYDRIITELDGQFENIFRERNRLYLNEFIHFQCKTSNEEKQVKLSPFYGFSFDFSTHSTLFAIMSKRLKSKLLPVELNGISMEPGTIRSPEVISCQILSEMNLDMLYDEILEQEYEFLEKYDYLDENQEKYVCLSEIIDALKLAKENEWDFFVHIV